jgi:hypothetical protein
LTFIALTVTGPPFGNSLTPIALTVSTAGIALVTMAAEEDGVATAAEVAGEADTCAEVRGATADETTDGMAEEAGTLLATDSAAEPLSGMTMDFCGLPGVAW